MVRCINRLLWAGQEETSELQNSHKKVGAHGDLLVASVGEVKIGNPQGKLARQTSQNWEP